MISNADPFRRAWAVFLVLSLIATATVGAQEGSDAGASTDAVTAQPAGAAELSAARAGAQQRLDAAVAELSQLRETIAQEKIPLAGRLNELEDELRQVRAEYQDATRQLDNRTLSLTNLRKDIEGYQAEKNYVSTLMGEYVRNFESRIHIAEIQRYRDVLDAANQAAQNENLTDAEIYQTQAAVITASLGRLEEALGGTRFDGTAVAPSGLVKHGTFALIGPVALFRSDDGQVVGTAEQRLGSLEPTVVEFESDAMTKAAAALVANGSGTLPLDPTLGNAHKIEATKQSLFEHISKGGVVMWPILGLFAAAMGVAIFKWVELARVRQPSSPRIIALLDAVSRHDKGAAADEAAAIGGPTGEMLSTGVNHIEEPPALIEEVMYEKILTTKLRLNSLLPFIGISAAAAPLLGLLGTVTGIINTFKLITVFGSGDVKMLSGGISEALITTEFGLIVAIPSLLLNAFLSRKARGTVSQMEKAAIGFINQISKTPFAQQDETKQLAQMPTAVADEVFRRLRLPGVAVDETLRPAPYRPDSAGSMMQTAVIKVPENATVGEALKAIRSARLDEDIRAVFVVDENGKYVGNLHIRLLLTRPEETRIESLVDRDAMFVRVDADREEVRRLFRTHDLSAVPVLDHENQLVGRVIRNGE